MKRIALCLVTLITIMSLLVSCGFLAGIPNGSINNAGSKDNADDTADTPTSNRGEVDVPTVTPGGETGVNNVTNNSVTINTSGESTSYATALGLRSAVSIYCTFEMTYYSGYPWNPTPVTETYYTTGSGVIYQLDGEGSAFIITNYHVVYDANSNSENHISDEIYVYLYGLEASEYAISASFVGGSANYDIAVLRVDNSEVLKKASDTGAASAVNIADSDCVVPGEISIAIGNPAASDLAGISVTKGIVSVDSEHITMSASDNSGEVVFRVIRTDTPINSGNSGGGLYNGRGELIGIVNAKINSSSIENIGYAIPSNVARAIADNIIYYCYGKDCTSVMRGLLGVTLEIAALYTEYDPETGVIRKSEDVRIYDITSGGIAEGVLQKGDIIKSITIGERTLIVTRCHHVIDAMLDVRIGDTVSLTVERVVDGTSTEITFEIVIDESCVVAY